MGLTSRAMATARRARSGVGLLRRLYHLGRSTDDLARTVADHQRLIEETAQRAAVLEARVDHLSQVLGTADPREAVDIVAGVRDSVSALTVEVTEQLNRTSAVLAALAPAPAVTGTSTATGSMSGGTADAAVGDAAPAAPVPAT